MDEVQAEYGVGAGGFCVDGRRVSLSDGGAEVERIEHVIDRIDGDLCQASEQNAAITVFANVDLGPFDKRDVFGKEQIAQLLVVDLGMLV